jgi:hypothetical protein
MSGNWIPILKDGECDKISCSDARNETPVTNDITKMKEIMRIFNFHPCIDRLEKSLCEGCYEAMQGWIGRPPKAN